MCGIAGILNYQGTQDDIRQLGSRMLSVLRHRGPDAEGIWLNPDSGLLMGHRRLAIQDLTESGAQPMFSESERYCIAFNGEIYNFKELLEELSKLGHAFRGHSDTEVLLAAIEQWGLDRAIERCIGMFAIALWDNKKNKLYLLRDRVGEKPLYYAIFNRTLFYASELKAIETIAKKNDLLIDNVALSNFLRYGYINSPRSIYKNIFKLPAGNKLTIDKSSLDTFTLPSPESYWNLFSAARDGLMGPVATEDDAIEQFDDLLQKTIRRQLIADVNVGTFLSGGIDSTLVSAVAQIQSSSKIRTFTIGFHDKEYNEAEYAESISRFLGSDHKTVYASPSDTLNVIPELASIYDEPFADSSQIPSFLVSKIAKEDVTVCLSGDGGDELFAGYNRYMWLSRVWNKANSTPTWLRKIISKLLSMPSPHTWDLAYSLLKSGSNNQNNYNLIGLKIQKLAGILNETEITNAYNFLLSYWNKPDVLLSPDMKYIYSSQPDKFPDTSSFIENAMYWDQLSYLPGDNLAKVDRASMRVSLETRLPLLSHELLEYSWKVPLKFKVRGTKGKWIMRKTLEKYIPNELFERPKMGFSVPVAIWLRNELKPWAENLLFGNQSATDIFNTHVLRKTWDEHVSERYDHSHKLWTVLMFLSWKIAR